MIEGLGAVDLVGERGSLQRGSAMVMITLRFMFMQCQLDSFEGYVTSLESICWLINISKRIQFADNY
jgi:hypothetical protein